MSALTVSAPGFDFFCDLSCVLHVELSIPAVREAEHLANLKALPEAKLLAVALRPTVYENKKFRELTDEEFGREVFRGATLRLVSDAGRVIEHTAPDGQRFTVRDMLRALEKTELETRGETKWSGGIDVHHIFFEGLARRDDGAWRISWGS